MTKEEMTICKIYLEDIDRTHDCNEYKLLMELLEQQPSEDCVSKQVVKEGMIKYGFHAPDMTVTEFVEDELPPVTPTQRWIPVSERLPDTNETVLCWYEYYHWSLEKVLPEYGLGYYFKEVGAWGGEVANGLKVKVLAWQPLPQPYEKKER